MFDGLLATWTVTKPVNVPASETSSLSYAGRLQGEVVSGNYFTLLGVRALQGRLFTDDDDRTPNAHPVAVIGEAFWKNQLAADPNVVGRLVKLNGNPFTCDRHRAGVVYRHELRRGDGVLGAAHDAGTARRRCAVVQPRPA